MKIGDIFNILCGLPKTLLINFKYFTFKEAIKLPIFVSHKVKLKEISGKVIIDTEIRTGMIKFGFETIDIFHPKTLKSIWKVSGTIIFKGRAVLKNGTKINVSQGAVLIIEDNLLVNNNTSIVCNEKVTFRKNVLISWDCLIMDTDFHKIYDNNNQIINPNKEIIISENVWIGCRSTILKGSIIGPNNVIAANSLVSGMLQESNNIYGGIPTRKIKSDIHWEL